jgi:hypothetical protein
VYLSNGNIASSSVCFHISLRSYFRLGPLQSLILKVIYRDKIPKTHQTDVKGPYFWQLKLLSAATIFIADILYCRHISDSEDKNGILRTELITKKILQVNFG